jgi:AcrR family transcriptional regulator
MVNFVGPVARGPVGSKTYPKRKRDRRATEHALLRAASGLFASQGFERTTTRQIAARAGCAEALIYRYFGGKAGLLQALMQSEASTPLVRRNASSQHAANLEGEILELLQSEMDGLWSHRDFLRVAVPRAILEPSIGRHLRRVVGPDYRMKAIYLRLRELQKRGLVRGEEELKVLAQAVAVLGFGLGFVRRMVFGDSPRQTKKLAVPMARLLVSSVQRP